MKKIVVLFSICFTVFLTGCYYDKEDELYSSVTCDSSNVNFSGTISGLLNYYGCLGCHSGSAPSGNVNLQGYTNVKAKVSDGRLLELLTIAQDFRPCRREGIK
jgi:hypothetical protein